MDEMVRKAMQKWPNVPHCYGWLALDARGHWRMRDDHAQQHNLPGDRIAHPALLAFIARNYGHNGQGAWYFQNGPQRVYVDLEAAPFIVRTDPAQGLTLHTGEALSAPASAWLTDTGRLYLQQDHLLALMDDRDMAVCLACLHINGQPASDEAVMDWISQSGATGQMTLALPGMPAVQASYLADADILTHCGIMAMPRQP